MKMSIEDLKALGINEEQINNIVAFSSGQEQQKEEKEPPVITPIKPTSLHELQVYAKGTIIQLPDFAEGQPFVARVKRPSLLALAKSGKIPNSLLTSAATLFAKGSDSMDVDDEHMLSDMYDVCRVIAGATLVEPTLEEIEGIGLNLTDEQLMAIFSYTQSGINALKPFRNQQTGNGVNK